MSEKLIQLRQELAENPYVTFNSDEEGVSRVFDVEWDFHALNQNNKTLSFGRINEKYRHDIQSYLYALIQYQKEKSNSNSHMAVGSLKRIGIYLKLSPHVGEKVTSTCFRASANGKNALKRYMGLAVNACAHTLRLRLMH